MDKSLKEITDTLVKFAYNSPFTDSNAEQALDYVADVLAQGRLSLSDMRRLAYAFMCKSLEAEAKGELDYSSLYSYLESFCKTR